MEEHEHGDDRDGAPARDDVGGDAGVLVARARRRAAGAGCGSTARASSTSCSASVTKVAKPTVFAERQEGRRGGPARRATRSMPARPPRGRRPCRRAEAGLGDPARGSEPRRHRLVVRGLAAGDASVRARSGATWSDRAGCSSRPSRAAALRPEAGRRGSRLTPSSSRAIASSAPRRSSRPQRDAGARQRGTASVSTERFSRVEIASSGPRSPR